MNSFIKKTLSVTMFLFLMVLMLGISVKVNASVTDTVSLSNGVHSSNQITWTAAGGNITITQTKGSGGTNVSSNYVAAPRVYQNHIMSFVATGNYKITAIEMDYESNRYGGNGKIAGITLNGTAVVDDQEAISRTWDTTSGGTHSLSSVDPAGLAAIHIQNGGTNVQLRLTAIRVTYVAPAGSQLDAPTSLTVSEGSNVVEVASVTNATGYEVGLFTTADATEPEYALTSSTNSVEIVDVPQGVEYFLKARAIGDSSWATSAYSDSATAVSYTHQNVSTYTVTHIKTVAANQTEAPWTYYIVTGYIQELGNTQYSQLQIADALGDSTFLTVLGIENYESYGFSLGDKVTLKGYKSNSQLQGATVVEHTVDYGLRFSSFNTNGRLNVSYNASAGSEQVTKYSKVTQAQEDWTGTYLIVYQDGTNGYVFNSVDANNGNIATSIVNNEITYTDELAAEEVTIEASGAGYAINTKKGYIGNANGNALPFNTTPQEHTITLNETAGTVELKSNNRVLKFNSASTAMRFRYYQSGQKDICLYKKTSDTATSFTILKDDNDKNLTAMMFGSVIDKSLYDSLMATPGTTFGILYTRASTLGNETMADYVNMVNDGTFTFEEMVETAGVKSMVPTAARVDENGNASSTGDYYQFGVVISNISEMNFDVEVNAVCYVYYNGVYYLMNETTYSVNTIAQAYMNAADTSSYTDHLPMLNWLQNYKGTTEGE